MNLEHKNPEIKNVSDILYKELEKTKLSILNLKLPLIELKSYNYLENQEFLDSQSILIQRVRKLKEMQEYMKNNIYEEYLINELKALEWRVKEECDLKNIIEYFYDKIEELNKKLKKSKKYSEPIKIEIEIDTDFINYYEESEVLLLSKNFSSLKIKDAANEEVKFVTEHKLLDEKTNVQQGLKIEPKKIEETKEVEIKDNVLSSPLPKEEKIENVFSFSGKPPANSFLNSLQNQNAVPQNFFSNFNDTSSIFTSVVNSNSNQQNNQNEQEKSQFVSQGSALSKLTNKFNTKFQK
ncbi:hypothetical protein H312_02159 [Anncaliia algerae PRA339]|uniref:Uncharacterized protein n=1 Tax=Anncaliia algerae PRA339 TaxID=1288291 RepID=A0A059EZU4_9MICR|nr:hypothetical protein H312_02159 [Anncaliia algerae PRA339]